MDATPKPNADDIPLEPLLVRNVMQPSPRVPTWFLVAIASIGVTSTVATVALPFVVLFALDGPDVVIPATERVAPAVVEAPAPAPASPSPTPSSSDFVLIVTAGARHFAILQAIDRPEPLSREANEARERRAEPSYGADVELLGEEDFPDGALLPAAGKELPPSVSAWIGQSLRVENECEVTVNEVVELALLTGTPDYVDGPVEGADAHTKMLTYAFDYGTHYFATELRSCKVGQWARLATLPVAYPAVDAGPPPAKLLAAAKKDLTSTAPARAAQERWESNGNAGKWHRTADSEIEVRYVTHPRTGEHWLVLHALVDYSCGGSEINLIGIYRREGEQMVRYHVGEAESLVYLSELIDVDGDGLFEILGNAYLSGPALATDRGVISREVVTPFYGCPC